jgi:hypothetical protein
MVGLGLGAGLVEGSVHRRFDYALVVQSHD